MAPPEFQYIEKGAQDGSNISERQALNTKSPCFQAQQQTKNSALEYLGKFQEDKERRRQSVFGSGLGLPRTADELRSEQLWRTLKIMSLRDRLTTGAKEARDNRNGQVWRKGSKVEAIALEILFDRMQQDLSLLVAKYGPYGVPGSAMAPKYSYLTTTPAGAECCFFITALAPNSLTYGLVEEVLAGLKIFLLDQSRFEQVVFDVENQHRMKGFAGLSIGPALSSNTSVTDNPANLTGIADIDITLRCTYGISLDSSAIIQVLGVARMKAMTMIGKEGPRGLLPGQNGEWDAGVTGAAFQIQGIPPDHLTWVMMQGAVQALRVILIVGKVPKEAKCTMNIARGVVGMVFVKKQEDSWELDTQ
ncbi:MAG: hypothetical protein Q9201_003669 [Fulgogasparrea decipioides]